MADAVRRLRDDPELRSRMGERARYVGLERIDILHPIHRVAMPDVRVGADVFGFVEAIDRHVDGVGVRVGVVPKRRATGCAERTPGEDS